METRAHHAIYAQTNPMGYKCHIPQVKPLQNQRQRQKRLTFFFLFTSQLVGLCYVHERGTERVSVCVGASLIDESKAVAAAAAAASVLWSALSFWMLALPLSAVGRSLTVSIHTFTQCRFDCSLFSTDSCRVTFLAISTLLCINIKLL